MTDRRHRAANLDPKRTTPLTADEVREVDAIAAKRYVVANEVIAEPKDNAYGAFRVLRRSDSLFVVRDTKRKVPSEVYVNERAARERAVALSGVAGVTEVSTVQDLRDWLSSRPHAGYCRCTTCVTDQSATTMSINDGVQDVCPMCGLHMLGTVAERVQWLQVGGDIACATCAATKTRAPAVDAAR